MLYMDNPPDATIKPPAFSAAKQYEVQVPANTVLPLHHLCTKCSRLSGSSFVLITFEHWVPGQPQHAWSMPEKIPLYKVSDLKKGYFEEKCHLCALIWIRANARALYPGDESTEDPYVYLNLWPIPWSYDSTDLTNVSYYVMVSVYDEKTKSEIAGGKPLHIYLDSDRHLDELTIREGQSAISSKGDGNMDTITTWYNECLKHEKCLDFTDRLSKSTARPARLLDLRDGKVRLECDTESIKDLQYVTLSHMWGKNPKGTLSLTEDKLGEFCVEIPTNGPGKWPSKYNDAVRIARYMGFHYIWIDSLCIKQDSEDDWKQEGAKMDAIYGGTTINISYLYPEEDDVDSNFLRDPRTELPCRLPLRSLHTASEEATEKAHEYHGFVVHHSRLATISGEKPDVWNGTCPLLLRGWVCQERFLCPRNVYVGHRQLFWECCEKTYDEFKGEVKMGWGSKQSLYNIFNGEYMMSPDYWSLSMDTVNGFLMQWPYLVDNYRRLHLTYESDRPMAFAGIAKAMHRNNGLTYLAGLWKETIEYDLIWSIMPANHPGKIRSFDRSADRRPGNPPKMKEGAKPQQFPSWSWFSIPTRDQNGIHNELEWYRSRRVRGHQNYITYRAKVVSFDHPSMQSNPDSMYFEFEGLKITVQTHLLPAELKWGGDSTLQLWANGKPPSETKVEYFHDVIPTVQANLVLPSPVSMMLVVVGEGCLGLVITPSEENMWRRVGYFETPQYFTFSEESLFNSKSSGETLVTLV